MPFRRLSLLGASVVVSAGIVAAGVVAAALAQVADDGRLVWLWTFTVFAALWLALTVLVRGASRTLDRQRRLLRERTIALSDAYGALEQRSLEAIESLNATVEARDPAAAGQSGRVQRLALAIGRRLGLEGDELESLAHGALLHDIGNVAVPDAVLTKPGPLDRHEHEQVKLHPEEGAAIVGRLSALREAVPVVRHHHERWDGGGYPDGLAGADIPRGAAIVAVAAAWEAMTRHRPYRWGLAPSEALGEIVAGRGTQFCPAVVDAFVEAVGTRPDEFWFDRRVLARSRFSFAIPRSRPRPNGAPPSVDCPLSAPEYGRAALPNDPA